MMKHGYYQSAADEQHEEARDHQREEAIAYLAELDRKRDRGGRILPAGW